MAYEPQRVLRGLQGVKFQGKKWFTKWSQTSRKSILVLHKVKKWTENIDMTFWYLPCQCRADGREYALSLCPITGAGFWKTSLTKVDNYHAKNLKNKQKQGTIVVKSIFFCSFFGRLANYHNSMKGHNHAESNLFRSPQQTSTYIFLSPFFGFKSTSSFTK